jgi:hypothetical protein
MAYQVIRNELTAEGSLFVMQNGESVLVRSDGSSRCLNIHGRGLADTGRFAHICLAMRSAVRKFLTGQCSGVNNCDEREAA